jgi:hypothetical protein
MRANPGVEVTTVLPRDVWTLIALRLPVATAVKVLGQVNSFFNTLVRTSSRFWFGKFNEQWGGAIHPRTVAQVCSAMGDSVSFYTAFKSRVLAEKSFHVVALDVTSNIAATGGTAFGARVGYACGHLWSAGSGLFNCAAGDTLDDEIVSGYEEFAVVESCYHGKEDWPHVGENMNLATLIPTYHQWFGPPIDIKEEHGHCNGGFNAIVAALLFRHVQMEPGSIDYFGEEKKANRGGRPALLVAAPVALRSSSAFYESLHNLIPMCPYVLMVSVSEVLSGYYEAPNCLAVIANDCGVSCSVVLNYKEDPDSVQLFRLRSSLLDQPPAKVAGSRASVCATLASNAELLQFVAEQLKAATLRTSVTRVVLGGLVTDVLEEAIRKVLPEGLVVLRPAGELSWEVAQSIAVQSFAAAPSVKSLFQPIQLHRQAL